ncbi:MAG: DUF4143 domain-containing protein, partial [Nanoarchaeota archaeon]|nr:DUF4143 domain-containing protein [Nanoarchaeota archaeon]
KKGTKLKFWRNKSGSEVDFILDENQVITPIEIKSQPKTTKSFLSFISQYNVKKAYILSMEEKESIIKCNCQISFIPFVKFL